MQIDLFTLVAQIVNFVILILLLRHFLYGRITRAMDERRQTISDRLAEARQKKEQADEEAGEYRRKKSELDEKRDEILAEAKELADQRREEMEENARKEVRGLESKWRTGLRRDKERFLRHLRETAGREFFAMAERALSGLANRDLEDQMVAVFLERLGDLEQDDATGIVEAAEDNDGEVVVRTSFDLSGEQHKKVTAALQDALGKRLNADFRTDEELICGIELAAGGLKVGWSVDSYLDALEGEMAEELASKVAEPVNDETAGGKGGGGGGDGSGGDGDGKESGGDGGGEAGGKAGSSEKAGAPGRKRAESRASGSSGQDEKKTGRGSSGSAGEGKADSRAEGDDG